MSISSESCTKPDSVKYDAILTQAITIFAADGFARGDVQTIANVAGVGKGTVYRYFGNKLDLFYACTLEIGKRMEQYTLEAIADIDSPLEKIRVACMSYAEFFQNSPEYLELWVQDRAEFRGVQPEAHYRYHNKIIDYFADILQQAVDRGECLPVDTRKTIVSLTTVLLGSLIYSPCFDYPEGRQETMTSMARYTIDVFIRGLQKNPDSSIGNITT